MKRFVKRKIRDGRVKIYGRWFYPDDRWMKYDGRLDEIWYWFGLYFDRHNEPEPFVSLWGTDDYWRKAKDPDWEPTEPRPECVDGYFPWQFWKVKNERI